MQILGLTARNIGDGTTIELSWSTADPTHIAHFIVQRWDRHRRRWLPYDGFHGIVRRIVTEVDDNPPQRLLVEIEDAVPSQQTLRVKAAFHDGQETDWATTSVQLAAEGVRLGDSKIWYVREGLFVSKLADTIVQVAPGFAVCAGIDRGVPSPISLALPDHAVNMTYVVYVDEHGIVRLAAGAVYPAMLLARVYVDAAGHIADIQDLRYLWPPEGVAVNWSHRSPRHAIVSWSSYGAINLKQWRIWRQENDGNYIHVGDVDKDRTFLEDSLPYDLDGIVSYQVAAIDLGDNVSTRSLPVQLEITQATAPSPPINVRGRWSGHPRNPRVLLEWEPSPSQNIEHYRIYKWSSGEWLYWGRTDGPNTAYLDAAVSRSETIVYAVTAMSEHRQESDYSDSVTVMVGPAAVPKAPEWPLADAIATGQDVDGTVWIRLRWHDVTERINGDPLGRVSEYEPDGLEAYDIWFVDMDDNDEHHLVASVPVAASLEWEIRGLTRGREYTYVIRARDGWGYQSDDSVPRTIIAGDTRLPGPPELVWAESMHDGQKDVVELEWTAPTHYVDLADNEEYPLPADLIDEYVIYRSDNPTTLLNPREVGRTKDTIFIDATAQRGMTYTYATQAVTKTGNESALSNVMSVTVGEFDKPPAPVWVSVATEIDEHFEISNVLEWRWDEALGGRPAFLRGVAVYEGYQYRQIGFIPAQLDEGEPTVFIHQGVTNGHSYRYLLKAIDTSGNESDFSEPQTVVAGSIEKPEAPDATLTPKFTDGVSGILIQWQPVNKDEHGEPLIAPIVAYRIYRSYSGMHYTLLQEVDAAETTFLDEPLDNGQTYFYRITAVNALGVEGSYVVRSQHAGDIIPPGEPEVDIDVHFSEQNPTAVTIEIEAASEADDLAGFRLYASTNPLKRTEVGFSTDGYFEMQMPYGATWHIWVTAIDEAENESPAFYTSLTPIVTEPAPVDEQSLSLTFVQDGERFQPRLTWDYPAANWIRHFEIYVHDEELDDDILIATVPADQRLYVGGSVAVGKEYVYGIRVRNVFESRSDIVYVAGQPAKDVDPKPPTNVAATGDTLSILVTWDAPTENVDDTPLEGVRRYIVEASYDNFATVSRTFVAIDTSITHNVSGAHTWKYRVKAEDWFGRESAWSSESNPAQAQDINIDLDDDVPSQPQWLLDDNNEAIWSTGIDHSSIDEGQFAWVELHWQPGAEPFLAGYYIEYSDDEGDTWHRIQQAPATAGKAKIARLLTGASLWFRLIAFTQLLATESPPSTPLAIVTAGNTVLPPAPAVGSVTEGKGLLGVQWEPVDFPRLSHYELQFQATTNPDIQDPNRWPSDVDDEHGWHALPGGKTTFYMHDELRYDQSMDEGDTYTTYYRYRVRAVSLSRHPVTGEPIVSEWLIVNPDGNRPRQTGQQDLATGSIVARLLYGQIIRGEHIQFDELTGDHVKLNTLTGQHFQAKSVFAETLEIYPGAQNWVKNSAFGLRALDGTTVSDWELHEADVADGIDVPGVPVGRFALRLDAKEDGPWAKQAIDAAIGGRTVILSAYASWSELDEGYIELRADGQFVTRLTMTGTSSWTRLISEPVELPTNADIDIFCHLGDSDEGELWTGGIKLETGDVATDWLPYPGESYMAGGSVQIGSDGVRITNGRLLIQTDDQRVRITSQGLFAGDDDQSHFASLTHQGLDIVNGKFSLKTGNDSLIINHEGISAYRNAALSVKIGIDGRLLVHDGNLIFKTAASGSRLELDHEGLRGYHQQLKAFELDTNGYLTLRGGQFKLLTADSEQDAGLSLTAAGLVAKDGSGPTIQISSSGTMHAARGFVLGPMNPDPAGQYLRMDPTEIYGQDGPSKYFKLTSKGTAEFTGSIVIKSGSQDPDRQIVIDADGIYIGDKTQNPAFLLTQGFGSVAPGLYLRDTPEAAVEISVGDVRINSSGITIDGEDGLTITTGSSPVIQASHEGVKVLAGAGILVKDSGTIAFGSGQTAIDAIGIHASAISTGVLTISGDDNDTLPRIVVIDNDDPVDPKKVEINRHGVHVYGGAFHLYGSSGQTIIENGEIKTEALDIGHVGGANVVKNGRGDFANESGVPDSWEVSGGQLSQRDTISEAGGAPKAGMSGQYAMRFQSSQSQGKFWQELTHDFRDDTYALQAWVWVVSGSIRVQLLHAVDANGDAIDYEVAIVDQWQEVFIHLKRSGGTPTLQFVAGDANTVAYVTDVSLVKGRYATGYQRHTDELAAVGHGVYINERGLQIYNGQLEIRTANNGLTINNQGIYHDHFELGSSGLEITFENQSLTLNDQGLKAGSGSNYALLDADGLTVMGGAIYVEGVGQHGHLVIDNNRILLGASGQSHSIEISPQALTITDGAFKFVSSAIGSSQDQLFISDYGLRIGPSESNPVLAFGVKPDGSSGLLIDGGSISIVKNNFGDADEFQYVTNITDRFIETRRLPGTSSDNRVGRERFSRLESGRLIVGGSELDPEASAVAFVDSGTVEITGNVQQVLFRDPFLFEHPPHIIVSPTFFETVKVPVTSSQFLDIAVTNVTTSGFEISVYRYFAGLVVTGQIVSGSANMAGKSGTYIFEFNSFLLKAELVLNLLAASGHRTTAYISYRAWDPSTSSWGAWSTPKQKLEITRYGQFGGGTTFSHTIQFPKRARYQIRVEHDASYAGGIWGTCETAVSSVRGLDLSVDPSGHAVAPRIQWLAVERT